MSDQPRITVFYDDSSEAVSAALLRAAGDLLCHGSAAVLVCSATDSGGWPTRDRAVPEEEC